MRKHLFPHRIFVVSVGLYQMTEPVSSVFREIDDDMRAMQLQNFWQENRLWIFATIVLAIVATAGVSIWRGHVSEKNREATAQLMVALQDPAALDKLAADPSELGRPAHIALVRLTAASRALNKGDTAKALEIYDALAKDRSADATLRDLGKLYAIGLRLDSAPVADLDAQLMPLARSGEPWRFSALEMQGLLYAREGRMKDAADKMAQISGDPAAPQDARTRAFTLRELYQADAAIADGKSK